VTYALLITTGCFFSVYGAEQYQLGMRQPLVL